jgi:hypothetical protein
MPIEFFDDEPQQQFEPELRRLMAGAHRVDAAIAFVTAHGARVLGDTLNANPQLACRLVVSVRFPTNLTEVARLADRTPGRVFIHTGFRDPREEGAERGQFHSKVVLIERDADQRTIIVGSHNWTQNALAGHNLEAATIIHCREGEPFLAGVREHIERCIRQSEPFDPLRLRFYQAVQADLQPPKPLLPSDDFPGFEWLNALVIHAEAERGLETLPDTARLYLPIREPLQQGYFANQQQVWLFLYPAGSLIGRRPPTAMPQLMTGRVVMNNAANDAPVIDRAANCQLQELRRPLVTPLAGNIPNHSGELSQVVVRLDDPRGRSLVPLFHHGHHAPKMTLKVDYRRVDPDLETAATLAGENEQTIAPLRDDVEFRAPHHLIVQCNVRVPSQFLYPVDYAPRLRGLIFGDQRFRQSDEPRIQFDDLAESKMLSDYVYLAHYRLDDATMERIARQGTLFS